MVALTICELRGFLAGAFLVLLRFATPTFGGVGTVAMSCIGGRGETR